MALYSYGPIQLWPAGFAGQQQVRDRADGPYPDVAGELGDGRDKRNPMAGGVADGAVAAGKLGDGRGKREPMVGGVAGGAVAGSAITMQGHNYLGP